MVGAGAFAGTLSGGHTNAARSPDVAPVEVASDTNPSVTAPRAARGGAYAAAENTAVENTTVRAAIRTPAAAPAVEAAPTVSAASVVATRFPGGWQSASPAAPAVAARQALAFAAAPASAEPARAPAATSGYRLAAVDPEPAPMPKRVARPKPKNDVLFNDAQLASIKARLRLTPSQEQYWPQVEQALRAISWRIATEQNGKRPVRGSQAAMIDPSSPEVARLKSAAIPLIMSMREDQKQQVRQLAHTMGLSQVATMF